MLARRSNLSRRVAVFPHIAYLAALKPSRMNLSLTNMSTLLEAMGHPEQRFPSILVAGTNGKGSVTTYVSSTLRSMGFRVGTYYSPHLCRLHERIRLNGDEIPSQELDALIRDVRAAGRGIPVTYFECLTAVAARFFFERAVDVAVVEVGLGGRLDATNLMHAMLTVITGISLDHREHLGHTRSAILAEKLGIARAGVPLVANLGSARLLAQARRHCDAVGAPFHAVRAEDVTGVALPRGGGMRARVRTERRDYGTVTARMIGLPQANNIATAVRVIETLEDVGFPMWLGAKAGRYVTAKAGCRGSAGGSLRGTAAEIQHGIADAVRRGIASAFLAGRFQIVSREPRVILDVSHNEESLLAALETLGRISRPERTVIVFGVLAHKELGVFPVRAMRSARRIVVTSLRDRRGASEDRLRDIFVAAGAKGRGKRASVTAVPGMARAIREARRTLASSDTLLVMGSHVTVAESLAYI
jgi:dihydrofolate synthase/folylpolyglutamate synthase